MINISREIFFLKIFFFLAVLVVFDSCAINLDSNLSNSLDRNSISNSKSEPVWYYSSKANDSEYLYGIGKSSDLYNATKMALINASSRIRTSISSQTESISAYNNISSIEEFRMDISEKTEEVEFQDFQVNRSAKYKNEYYIEIKVNKSKFQKNYIQKLNLIKEDVASNIKLLENSDPLSKRVILAKIIKLQKQAIDICYLLSSSGAKVNPEIAQYSKTINDFNKLNQNLVIKIGKNKNSEIATNVIKALNDKNIKVSKEGDNIVLDIEIDKKKSFLYESYLIKLFINFKLISNDKIIASNQIEVSGSSLKNYNLAEKSALKSFDEEVRKTDILKILGVDK